MAASTNDKFKKVGASTVTSLAAPGKALGATSITVGSTTNFPTDTGIVIAIRVVDTAGKLVAGTYTTWSATVTSGTSLAIVATPLTGSDQVYSAGSTTQVYMPVSSAEHNAMVDGILAQHNQDGTHGAITATSINVSGAVTVPDKAVTLPKINGGSTAGVLLTDSSGVVTASSNIWWEELGRATATGNTTSLSVTIPPRRFIKVIANAENRQTQEAILFVRFNNVSANVYERVMAVVDRAAGSVSAVTTNASGISVVSKQNNNAYMTIEGPGKGTSGWNTFTMAGGSMADHRSGTFNFSTSADITTVSLTSSIANGISVGGTLVVLGHD